MYMLQNFENSTEILKVKLNWNRFIFHTRKPCYTKVLMLKHHYHLLKWVTRIYSIQVIQQTQTFIIFRIQLHNFPLKIFYSFIQFTCPVDNNACFVMQFTKKLFWKPAEGTKLVYDACKGTIWDAVKFIWYVLWHNSAADIFRFNRTFHQRHAVNWKNTQMPIITVCAENLFSNEFRITYFWRNQK